MATMMTINNKAVKMTKEDKARHLRVYEIGEAGHLGVESGSRPNTLYVVHHNGYRVSYCPCEATCRCSHMIAGDWYLEAERRAAFVAAFDPHGLSL